MERLPTLQYQLIGEFDTLLEYPTSSAISRSNLLQMMAINIFAITNTAAEGMVLCIQCHNYLLIFSPFPPPPLHSLSISHMIVSQFKMKFKLQVFKSTQCSLILG